MQAIIIADDKAIVLLRHDFGHTWPLRALPLSRIAHSAVQRGGLILLHLCRVRTRNLAGDMQTPHQTLAVQALRNTRCVEEIAHGRSSPLGLSRSPNPTQYTASGGSRVRLRTNRRSSSASCGFDTKSMTYRFVMMDGNLPIQVIVT